MAVRASTDVIMCFRLVMNFMMLSVNTNIKRYHKLVDLLLHIYTYMCSRNIKSKRKGEKNCSCVWRKNDWRISEPKSE